MPAPPPLQGQYASDEDFAALSNRMAEGEAGLASADRLFYLSIPPNIFTAVAGAASRAASSRCAKGKRDWAEHAHPPAAQPACLVRQGYLWWRPCRQPAGSNGLACSGELDMPCNTSCLSSRPLVSFGASPSNTPSAPPPAPSNPALTSPPAATAGRA